MATGYELGRSENVAYAGALYDGHTSDPFGIESKTGADGHSNTALKIGLDASRSSSIYGQSSTVQPPALRLLPCIKI